MEKLNKIIFYIFFFMYGVLVASYIFGFLISPKSLFDIVNFICSELLFITCMGVIYICYKKNPDSEKFRYIAMITNCIIYVPVVSLSGISEAFIVGVANACLYLLYFDVKVVGIYAIWVSIVTSINAIRLLLLCPDDVDVKTGLTQIMCTTAFAAILIFSTSVAKRHNDKKIADIQESRDKIQEIMNNIVNAVKAINEDAKEGKDTITELDEAIDKSVNIFERIADGNIENASSVQVQAQMTKSIAQLIETVVSMTKTAKNTSDLSFEKLDNSRGFIEELRQTSTNIVDVNYDVVNSMNNVIENMKRVKYITDWIYEISEETNLLSLNATIESAKAGQYGKGFAVVAEAIRKLSEQTSVLTEDIEEIISNLEKDTFTTKELLNKASDYIGEGNIRIENTIDSFNMMQKDMKNLSMDMERILSSTDNVVEYNNEVIQHIEQLSAETEEVTAFIEEAVAMNENNKIKTNKSKEIMNDVVREVELLLK